MITYEDVFDEIVERVANNEITSEEGAEILSTITEGFEGPELDGEGEEEVSLESYSDVFDSLAVVDQFLESANDTTDKTKADDVASNGTTTKSILDKAKEKLKKKNKGDEMGDNASTTTNVVKEAVDQRRLAVYEAYLHDQIDADEFENCMTLLNAENYPELQD